MVVLHPSLLPKYRGAAPIQYSLLNGDKEAGVSIIEISKNKFDAGKILLQEKVHVNPTARYGELSMELALTGGNRIIDFLENYEHYKTKAIPQDKAPYEASKAPKFKQEDTVLNWVNFTNEEIYNRYRAFYGSNFITVRTKWSDTWFFMDEMGLVSNSDEQNTFLQSYPNAEPGSIWVLRSKKYKNNMYVKCKQGWVEIRSGYLQDKKPAPVYKFVNQYIDKEKIYADEKGKGVYFFL